MNKKQIAVAAIGLVGQPKRIRKNKIMNKIQVTVLVAVLWTVNGCAPRPTMWTKDNYTEEEFKRDKYQCVQESRTQWSGGGTGAAGLFMIAGAQASARNESEKLFKMCMESKGWHEVDLKTAGTTGIKLPTESLKEVIVLQVIPASPAEGV